MSPVRLLPDAELLVTTFLRAHADVAALVGTRVTTELPPEPILPAVTVTRIGGVPSLAGYLDDARLEIAAWGAEDNKRQAEQVARTVEAAMLTIVGPQATGVVTNVMQEGLGLRWAPDETTDLPRYEMTFDLYIHP